MCQQKKFAGPSLANSLDLVQLDTSCVWYKPTMYACLYVRDCSKTVIGTSLARSIVPGLGSSLRHRSVPNNRRALQTQCSHGLYGYGPYSYAQTIGRPCKHSGGSHAVAPMHARRTRMHSTHANARAADRRAARVRQLHAVGLLPTAPGRGDRGSQRIRLPLVPLPRHPRELRKGLRRATQSASSRLAPCIFGEDDSERTHGSDRSTSGHRYRWSVVQAGFSGPQVALQLDGRAEPLGGPRTASRCLA